MNDWIKKLSWKEIVQLWYIIVSYWLFVPLLFVTAFLAWKLNQKPTCMIADQGAYMEAGKLEKIDDVF